MIELVVGELSEMRRIMRLEARAPTLRELRVVADSITAMTPADRPQSDSTRIIRAMRDGRQKKLVPPG